MLDESISFTFHSGYILMDLGEFRQKLALYFTFHSGYILIQDKNRRANLKRTLHSILVIF